MAAKKEDKEKIIIKQFKDSSSNWFVNYAHYYLNKSNELLWASGESDNIEYRTALEAYIKRNKKTFKPREESILDKEEKVYMTLNFGKFSGLKLNELVDKDKRYAIWIYTNTTDENIKTQLKELLKK